MIILMYYLRIEQTLTKEIKMKNKLNAVETKINAQLDNLDTAITELWNLMCNDEEFSSRQVARDLRSRLSGNAIYNLKQVNKDLYNVMSSAKSELKKEEV